MLILIRHATPEVNYGWCNAVEAKTRLFLYHTTQMVKKEEVDHFLQQEEAQRILSLKANVFCSDLERAKATADILFANYREVIALREADYLPVYIPHIKLPFHCWALLSRIKWLFAKESAEYDDRNVFLRRVKTVFDISTTYENCILVGHGFLFAVMKLRHLKKQGYRCTYKFKDGCFTVETWEKT